MRGADADRAGRTNNPDHERTGANSGGRSYTAIGTPVNVAARLEAEATPGSVLCSFSTNSPIRDRVDATPRGPLQLRGVSRTVDAYEIAGIADG